MNPELLKIESEEDAWRAFEQALKWPDSPVEARDVHLDLSGWPSIQLRVKGDRYRSTITTSLMKPILDLQGAVYASYAKAAYGKGDGRNLRKEERQKLEIVVHVEEGSSLLNIELGDGLKEIWEDMRTKMDGKQVTIVVLGLALVIGGVTAYKSYLSHQADLKELDHRLEMSKQETERMRILHEAMQGNEIERDLQSSVNQFRSQLLRAVEDADEVLIGEEIRLTGHQARRIAGEPRTAGIDDRIDGEFRVHLVDSSTEDSSLKLRVKKTDDGQEFTATTDISQVAMAGIEQLQAAVFEKKPIKLAVNFRRVRDEITRAKIISVG
ncbi:hypothetical protein [Natronospira bacteriovora]|uniref:Uncharacterized protein n=1 Tax=Natronospira bacteriovora TaxID=3069753 RepID=A0ABU0W749_9GAMM|nr:hypothetical protein [Natronospira sp. AB-CW4]MDQ2069295.1 hypothetical protein [Natronospira sp. AB-CW4]